MVAVDLAAGRVPVRSVTAVEVLVAALAGAGRHGGHPDMVDVGANEAVGLFEGEYVLETVTCE